jgi:diguanylate cyclase (GGDEF)-like protein/PAS domain S-box-containing protein
VVSIPATSPRNEPIHELTGDFAGAVGADVHGQRQALAHLADAEARFRSVFENSGIGMTITSLEGRYLRVNPAFARMVGRSVDELVGMHVREVTHPEELGREAETIKRLIADPTLDIRRQKRYVRPGGREVWASLTVSAVAGADGTARYVIAQMIDISNQHAAELALADSERRFRTLAVASPVGIFAASIDGRMMYANARMAELFGCEPDELDAAVWTEGVAPTSRHLLDRASRSLKAGSRSETVEVELDRSRTGARWVRIDIGAVPDGATSHNVVGTVTDVTAEVHARTELAAREAEFRLLAEHSGDFLSRHDERGRFLYASPACEALLGVRPEQLVGRTAAEAGLLSPEGDAATAAAAFSQGRDDGATVMFRIVRADGEVRWLETAARTVPHRDGQAREIVAVTRDVSDRKRAEAELAHQALHDTLTGLPNRALFLDRLQQALHRARRGAAGVAVLFVDLDRFKLINDSFGHAAGDRVLCDVAARLRETLRPTDTIARFGGDELTILCEGVTGQGFARGIAERIAALFEEPFVVDGSEVFLQSSIGIALAGPDDTPEDLLRDADAAMYRAKDAGRGGIEVFDEAMRAGARDRVATETALRHAIDRDQLRLHVQPVVALASRRIQGFEGLVRWEHPERGLIPPDEFIPLAEETGLIVPIGRWVLREVCRTLRRWHRELGREWVQCSVNLSVRDLQQPDLVDAVRAALEETGVPAHRLVLEITESAVMENATGTVDTLQRLKALGVRVALDDFGTGYSSLARLHQFPLTVMKVDRSFTAALDEDHDGASIAASIVSLGHALGLGVVAEGIEEEAQLRALERLGCAFGQGYHFARPAPPETFDDALLAAEHP